jgi:hypothetical protein
VSLPSKALTVLNLPEAGSSTVKFAYNYFTIDESVPGAATTWNQNGADVSYIVLPLPSDAGYEWYDVEVEKRAAEKDYGLPRHMTLTWSTPDISDMSGMWIDAGPPAGVNIRDNIDKILYAETMGNTCYMGMSLQDINYDQKFYDESISSFGIIGSSLRGEIQHISHDTPTGGTTPDELKIEPSLLDTKSRLLSTIEGIASGGNIDELLDMYQLGSGDFTISKASKELIYEALSNYQARGIAYISSEGDGNDVDAFASQLDEVKDVVHNMTLRTTLCGDIGLWSTQSVIGAYGDELRDGGATTSPLAALIRTQVTAISDIEDDGSISSSDYSVQIKTDNIVYVEHPGDDGYYDPRDLSTSSTDGAFPYDALRGAANKGTKLCIAGYLVEKKVAYADDAIGLGLNVVEPLIIELQDWAVGPSDDHFGASGAIAAENVTDGDIVYGAAYMYRVRTVYYVELDAINRTLDGDDTFHRVGVLIASRGTQWVKAVAIDLVPPPEPNNLNFIFDYVQQKLILNWEFPVNRQRDIKAFQVFRRTFEIDPFNKNMIVENAYDKPFRLMKEYNFNDTINPLDTTGMTTTTLATPTPAPDHLVEKSPGLPTTRWVDHDFTKSSVSIYAVTSIDARGMSSNLSQQFEVSFNERLNAIKVRYISSSGAPLCYPNIKLTIQYDQSAKNDHVDVDPFPDVIKSSGLDSVTIMLSPDYYTMTATSTGSPGVPSADTTSNVVTFGGEQGSTDETAQPVYKFNFINTDVQKSQVLDVYVSDARSSVIPDIPPTVTGFSPSGLGAGERFDDL